MHPDPKTLTDEQLINSLLSKINPLFEGPPATKEEKAFNIACVNEYIERKLSNPVIDDFIEFIGMMGL